MGTSSAYGGPAGGTPLVPTWLEPEGGELSPSAPEAPAGGTPSDEQERTMPPSAPPVRYAPEPASPDRFTNARGNFSRFARSGGSDRASLGRAVSSYVSTSVGGARQAARRMGASRAAGAGLLRFLSDATTRGTQAALHALNLDTFAGRPIEEVFVGLSEYLCPDTGTVDAGIARDAFIEMTADIAAAGVIDLDSLTPDQMQTVFELFATHAIEARLCNDIGMRLVTLPDDIRAAQRVQSQLRDFIRRGVADALTLSRTELQALTPERVLGFVDGVYETAFTILGAMGDAEAST